MRISIKELRTIIRETIIDEETWMPGKYYPGAEPFSKRDEERLNEPIGESSEENKL